MTKKVTKNNLTSEKQDCSTRNPLPRDTTMAQKNHDKIKISKLYWLNCRLCPFKTRKKDLMIEHMCSSHIGDDDVETKGGFYSEGTGAFVISSNRDRQTLLFS